MSPCSSEGNAEGSSTSSGTMPPSAWTREELESLNEEVEQNRDAELGELWRSDFAQDLDGLYDYVGAATAEWQQVVHDLYRLPQNEWQNSGVLEAAHKFPPAMANEMLGMGTWRLKGDVNPCIEFLVQRLEGTWREMCPDDLNIYPRKKWKGKYDICDSMDPNRELDGMSYADVPSPKKGEEGYPRLLLENRIYCSRVFRKLHVEVGHRQDGLQVLHAVLYPRYAYDVPILAMDLVVINGNVTLAIIDACPVRKNMQLPAHYLQTMQELQEKFLTDAVKQRRIPEWGTNIFSPACVCIQPQTPAELAGFLQYAVALHRAHMLLCLRVEPVQPTTPRNIARRTELLEGHKRFIDNQLANKKTTRVLEAAFNVEWATEYMRSIMFDFEPDDEPKWVDASMGKLYDYFDYYPELGIWPQQIKELEDGIALRRASETLDALVAGETVRQDKIVWSLQNLFERDPGFQAHCLLVLPEAADLDDVKKVGPFLASRLEELGLGEQQASWVE